MKLMVLSSQIRIMKMTELDKDIELFLKNYNEED